MTLKGHANTVTGLRVSPDGTHLLSNAMVRPQSQDFPDEDMQLNNCFALVCLLHSFKNTVCLFFYSKAHQEPL